MVVVPMTQRERGELAALLKRADEQRRKINALEVELDTLNQRIAKVRGSAPSERRRIARKKGARDQRS